MRLETKRLELRKFTADDLDWYATLYADPNVTRYLGGPKTRDEAEVNFTARVLDYYDANPGLGLWKTIERASGAPVGFHLLNHIQGESIVQVGYALLERAWGRGYATEMSAALLRYGFVDLELPTIAGMAHRDHTASHRVLEKIGLERRGERSFPHPMYADAGPLAWFEREREVWLAERP